MSLDWHHGAYLVELAVAMAEDSMVSRAHSADFTGRLAEQFVVDIEEAAECGDWELAHESLGFYKGLPFHSSFYTPSEELIVCALRELRRLADRTSFEIHELKSIDHLLSFLGDVNAQDDLPREFARMKQLLSVPIEQRRPATSTPQTDTQSRTARVEFSSSKALMLRRIGLLMDHLLQLQEPPQEMAAAANLSPHSNGLSDIASKHCKRGGLHSTGRCRKGRGSLRLSTTPLLEIGRRISV
jgi:hypothetical protein